MLFFHQDLSNSPFELNPEESRHCVRVLRKQKGDFIEVMDGKGTIATGEIVEPNPKGCLIEITNTKKTSPVPYPIHLVVAPTKNLDRMEWLIEKATELGLTKISFVLCKNSERKVLKMERLLKKAISAIKQSGNAFLPTLKALAPFSEVIDTLSSSSSCKLIAHLEGNTTNHLKDLPSHDSGYTVLIGPEGDFTKEEIKHALSVGFAPVTLGNNILRTETAALYSLITLSNK